MTSQANQAKQHSLAPKHGFCFAKCFLHLYICLGSSLRNQLLSPRYQKREVIASQCSKLSITPKELSEMANLPHDKPSFHGLHKPPCFVEGPLLTTWQGDHNEQSHPNLRLAGTGGFLSVAACRSAESVQPACKQASTCRLTSSEASRNSISVVLSYLS